MSNKFKSNLLAIMVTVAPYQECHYHAGMPLEFLKECFEQFTESVCEEEYTQFMQNMFTPLAYNEA